MSRKGPPGAGDGSARSGQSGVLNGGSRRGPLQTRYQQILETAFDFVLELDLDGRLTYVNRTVKGIAPDSVIGTHVADWSHPDDAHILHDVVRQVRETRRTCEYKVRARGDDGSISHYFSRMAPQLVDGQVVALTVCATDITELVRKEEALLESEQRFYRAIDEAPFPAIIHSDDGEVLHVNRVWSELSGYDVDGVSSVEAWRAMDDRGARRRPFVELLCRGDRNLQGEVSVLAKDGEERVWDLKSSPLEPDASGRKLVVTMASDVTARSHARTKLEEAKALLTAVFNNSPVGMIVTDATGLVTMVNPAAMRIRGEELQPPIDPALARTGWDLLDVDGETPLPHEATPIGRAHLQGISSTNVELIIRRPSGEHRWVLTSAAPFGPSPERLTGAIAVFQDITEWKQAERELVQIADFYRAALEGSLDAFYVLKSQHDENGEIIDFSFVDVNRRGEERLGKRRDDLIGRRIRDLFAVYRDEEAFERYRRVALTGESFEEEMLIPPGEEFSGWYYRQVVPLSNGIAIMSRDITERRKQEDALRRSEQRYRDIVETAQEGIWVIDDEAKTTFANARMAEMLGTTRQQMAGKPLFTFMDDGDRGLAEELLERRRMGLSEIHEFRFLRQDGASVWTLLSTNPLRDGEGRYIGALAMVTDITERKRAAEEAQRQQDELARADKLITLGTLVAGAAHEINNPNYVISLNLPTLRDVWMDSLPVLDAHHREHPDFMLGGLSYSEMRREVPKLVDQSISSSERIKHFVAELRRFSRGETTRIAMRRIDVGDVVESAVALLAGQIRKATDAFHVRRAESIPEVLADAGGLEQVIINVVLNACQSLTSRKQGIWVETGCDPDGKRVTITVRDEGGGIPTEHLSRVQEPFFTTRRDSGGTGLGLAVSTRILDRHGGTLSFESEPGQGTVATISLPAAVGAS